MTGWFAFSRSPTSCASLNPCGSTTWTLAAWFAGIGRMTGGFGDGTTVGSSVRGSGLTVAPGSGMRG